MVVFICTHIVCVFFYFYFFFFKQKTAYEMRISDWSSDVCSSDLLFCAGVGVQHPDVSNASRRIKASEVAQCQANGVTNIIELKVGVDGLAVATGPATQFPGLTKIGRASCRERVCQYV